MGKRVVVTGGVTGGHVLPALAVARALGRQGHRVTYIGGADQLDAQLARRYQVDFAGFRFHRHGFWARWFSLVRATVRVLVRLARDRPDVIFSTGSLVGVPVVLAGRALRVPVVLHDSDSRPGDEVRRLAPLSRRVCVGFPTAAAGFGGRAVTFTGNPTRPDFAGGSRIAALRRYGLPSDRPLVFVVGGSQGAVSLNRLVWGALPELLSSYSIVHSCGVGKTDPSIRRPGYVQLEFVHEEIRDIYAASDLVVSRAGAGAIEEALAYRVPALYVPYPWGDGHQEGNARLMAAAGVADVLPQPGLTEADLLRSVHRMIREKARYQAAFDALERPDAVAVLCRIILDEAGPVR